MIELTMECIIGEPVAHLGVEQPVEWRPAIFNPAYIALVYPSPDDDHTFITMNTGVDLKVREPFDLVAETIRKW